MKRISIFLPVMAMAVAASCDREPAVEKLQGKDIIRVSANMETKAMIGSGDEFSAFTLYGQTLDNSGTAATAETIIDSKTTSFANSKWTIAGGDYPWTKGKDHAFFGWLTQDSDGGLASSLGSFSFADSSTDGKVGGTLTVPKTTMGLSADRFDFCYSDVEYRSAARANYSEVVLGFKHLFAAFGFSAHNYTTEPVTITSLILYNIKDGKGATISFTDEGASVIYGAGTAWSTGNLIPSGGITLTAEESAADIIGEKSSTVKYYMVWPQTAVDLAPSDPIGATGTAYVEVQYTQGGGDSITKNLAIPIDEGIGWPAGSRRKMELSFGPRSLTLTSTLLPWNKTDASIDYTGLVSVGVPLKFDDATCIIDKDNKKIYFKGDFPIKATFRVDQPLNGSWLVSKSGDFDAFEVDNTTMDIGTGESGDGIDTLEGMINPAKTTTISIYPKIATPERDYTMQLVFSVRSSSGLVTDINNKVQTEVYTIVLLKK